MDLIRSECNGVNVGGLELAVQKPEERWGSGLSLGKAPGKVAGNQSSENRLQGNKTKGGRHLGNWKGSEGGDCS